MAKRGSTKWLSVQQEDFIAKVYEGVRSKSSGAADTDAGDVRSPTLLIECKMTGGPGKTNRKPKYVREFEKVTEEAWAEGREPRLCLRFYDPESILADKQGWIDLTIQRTADNRGRLDGT